MLSILFITYCLIVNSETVVIFYLFIILQTKESKAKHKPIKKKNLIDYYKYQLMERSDFHKSSIFNLHFSI